MLKRLVTIGLIAAGGTLLMKQMQKKNAGSGSHVVESIDVNVPVRTAYDQFTQFEEFPQFMDSVHEVHQLDDKRLHWKADVMGKPVEWDAEITEQIPDQRIAWQSTSGPPNGGQVSFQRLSDTRTRIKLDMNYEPRDALETIGDAMGAVRMQAKSNLKRFKELIEKRGSETGAWRGTITPEGGVSKPH